MKKGMPWWLGGILMSGLVLLTFSVFGADRPMGASSFVPYLAGMTFGLDPETYTYLKKIEAPGAWEGILLLGALFGAFITSIFITKTFKLSLIPECWVKYRNNSIVSRMIWSFFAGMFMIIGARLAGGCTSGHFMSGMSQMALSAMIFAGAVMISLVVTGRLFYRDRG